MGGEAAVINKKMFLRKPQGMPVHLEAQASKVQAAEAMGMRQM